MRVLSICVLILLTFSLKVVAVTSECESALRTLFSENVSKEKAGEFLGLQGQITLHRLAWTYLRAQKDDGDQKLQSVERTILALLNDKYTNSDEGFIKAREAFESQPLSRATLAEIAPYLREALLTSYGEGDQNFRLNASDLKLLAALAKQEKASAVNGVYSHKLLNDGSSHSILNFTKLVNSGYKTKATTSEEDLEVDVKLKGLEETMEGMQDKLSSFLNTLEVPNQCAAESDCVQGFSMSELFNQIEEVQGIFWAALEGSLLSDDLLVQKLGYGDMWLKVGKVKPIVPTPVDQVGTIETKGARPQAQKSLSKETLNDINVIVADKAGRTVDGLSDRDPAYLKDWAKAIVEGKRYFVLSGKVYDSGFGTSVKKSDLAAIIAKDKKGRKASDIVGHEAPYLAAWAEAVQKGTNYFHCGERICERASGTGVPKKELAAIIAKAKPGRKVEDQIGKEGIYLASWANALEHGDKYFPCGTRLCWSETGSGVKASDLKLIIRSDGRDREVNKPLDYLEAWALSIGQGSHTFRHANKLYYRKNGLEVPVKYTPAVKPVNAINDISAVSFSLPFSLEGTIYKQPFDYLVKTVKEIEVPEIEGVNPLITDPVNIIVKDGKGRTPEAYKNFGKGFLNAWADAIVMNKAFFIYGNGLYHRKNGGPATEEELLAVYSNDHAYYVFDSVRDNVREVLSKDPAKRVRQLEALVNFKKTFTYQGELYDRMGNLLDPATAVSDAMNSKLGYSKEPSRYKGQEKLFLIARANALMNDRPSFYYKDKVYDSLSGYSITSSKRHLAATDEKIEKNRRRVEVYSSDEDLIKNFHKDHPNTACKHYGIIDKTAALLKIYTMDGTEVYHTEILVGINESDQRTKWVDYENHITNGNTGAGVYTVRPHKKDSYNERAFKDNIISFKDEKGNEDIVFAIHQVPVNLQTRYAKFGTNDPNDRRQSSGCGNVKESDFDEISALLGVQCQVFVLPEEKSNKFIIQDEKLLFTTTSPSADDDRNYNFSPKRTHETKDIKFRITNEEADTETSRTFLATLETEKENLMKLYNLTNDEYNDLALMAFGVLGNESDFGKSKKYAFKEMDSFLFPVGPVPLYIPDGQTMVIVGKGLTGSSDPGNTSRGMTQIKILPTGKFEEAYPGIKKDNLTVPKNAAIATLAYLAEASKILRNIAAKNTEDSAKVQINRETMLDFLGYIYQGKMAQVRSSDPSNQATPDYNGYLRNLKRHMSYVELSQKIE